MCINGGQPFCAMMVLFQTHCKGNINAMVLWQNEELNKDLRQHVRENANVKGKPNMIIASLCQWVYNEPLSNHVLEPGFPRKIRIDIARRWLHHLGFRILDRKKGT